MYGTMYKLYKDQVFVLAKTLIVKHDELATAMNYELSWGGYFNEGYDDDPREWRYYKNMAGEYHQYDIDYLLEKYGSPYITVQIPTVDGSKEVPFTKELLNGDNADVSLANEFAIGSKLYNDTVKRYPELEQLIIGIVNPIDIEVAVSAQNGEILHIDGFYKTIEPETGRRYFATKVNKSYNVLIEPQEHNFIEKLQLFIYHYLDHWVNAEYIHGNDLYAITTIGQLYTHIPNVIMNIRLGNCRTNYAHSFHIKMYLESFGLLGRYVDYIPLESSLWLYRNTMYHEANRGKHLTFNAIIDNLWTPNRVPINAYSIRHELSSMGGENLLPNGMLYKEVLNFAIPGVSDHDRTVRDILEDQVPLARDNHKDLDEKEARIQEILNWGGDDRLQTKVLESEMMDMGEPYPFDLNTMLLNHWGYTAHKGYYKGTVYATHPISGDRIGLTPLNAYLLTVYCLNLAVADNKLENIPYTHFYDIPRTDNPPDFPTEEIFEPKPTLEKAYSWVDHTRTRKRKVEEVLGTHKPKFEAYNSNTFYNNVEEIYRERVRKYHAYSNTEDFKERGDLHLVAGRCYWQGFKEQLAVGSYDEWLRVLGINFDSFEKTDYLELGLNLIANALGIDEDKNNKKRWLQKAMVAILKHFISYTVHLIEKFADGVVTYLGMQTVRFCNFKWEYKGMLPARWQLHLDYKARLNFKFPVSLSIPNIFDYDKFKINIVPNMKVKYDVGEFEIRTGRYRYHIGRWELSLTAFNLGMIVKTKDYLPFPNPPGEQPVSDDRYVRTSLYPIEMGNGDNSYEKLNVKPVGISTVVTPAPTHYTESSNEELRVSAVGIEALFDSVKLALNVQDSIEANVEVGIVVDDKNPNVFETLNESVEADVTVGVIVDDKNPNIIETLNDVIDARVELDIQIINRTPNVSLDVDESSSGE